MRERIIGRDCRVNGVDYLLMRLSYAHPEKMPAELVSSMFNNNVESIDRQKLVEQSIEQARREKSKLDELDIIERENTAKQKQLDLNRLANISLASNISNIEHIRDTVCQFYGVDFPSIASSRAAAAFHIRAIICYLARHLTRGSASYPTIAPIVGYKDHTGAMYGFNKIKDRLEHDQDFAIEISNITDRIEKYSEAA